MRVSASLSLTLAQLHSVERSSQTSLPLRLLPSASRSLALLCVSGGGAAGETAGEASTGLTDGPSLQQGAASRSRLVSSCLSVGGDLGEAG
ncbi:hypothetical protein cyc_09323 [Cyclospora cayetanensis]|uniref:Uncharacterized protein n=1 Tax=Cyclospora cayetanensis TaxID=88456 RepID=A0A1D3CX98_9EIME|nr:hypothetical protein cyc_09323 [Cyclospora cayetanensis]